MESIIGVINVYHAFIGTQQYNGRTNRKLAESGVFFYDHFFHVGDDHCSGTLESVPLPPFTSLDWPLPTCDIKEAFRMKLYNEVQKGLKPNVASRLVKIKVCMPIPIFVDFFSQGDSPIVLKNTMLVCKDVDPDTVLEFLDKGWDIRVTNNIQCKVDPSSVNVKYMIKSQNFIMSFFYQRAHRVNGTMVPLDQDLLDMQDNQLIQIDIWMNEFLQTTLSLLQECTLHQLRQDLISEDEVELPEHFVFQLNGQRVREKPFS